MKVLLDTCVWLDYIWQKRAEDYVEANESKKLIDRLNGDKRFEIVLSPFLIREISSHYSDWFLLQKVVKNGFSFNEFKKVKHKYSLDEKEIKEIDDIILTIGSIKNVNVLQMSALAIHEVERILLLEADFGFDVYDAIHFNTAIENNCNSFVTRDSGFRRSASNYISTKKIKMICMEVKGLLRSI